MEEVKLCNSHAFNEDIGSDELGEDYVEINSGFSEEGLVQLIALQIPTDELHHALLAIEIAKCSKIFPNHGAQWQVCNKLLVKNALSDDFVKLMQWKAHIKRDIVMQNADSDTLYTVKEDSGAQVDQFEEMGKESHGEVSILQPEASLPAIDPTLLNFD